MKRRWIPPFLMLFAGAVSSVIMFLLHYEIQRMLFILLGILIGFYIAGSLFKWMLDVFDHQNEEAQAEAASDAENAEMTEETEADMEEGQVKAEG